MKYIFLALTLVSTIAVCEGSGGGVVGRQFTLSSTDFSTALEALEKRDTVFSHHINEDIEPRRLLTLEALEVIEASTESGELIHLIQE
ncbi:hypothetical protein [Pseudobacteriovorax antillogorgiicola]|uniref:Uncharacterized protein n=1 Tax=Pseudobacteriovorax antillogorgiicola TaxID=1513793 RepID=A0A1Y6BH26_9BACT|nr:hypothetical protein [Pseudobacteriovorax antillogorgiicola]TCS56305.1 hypothetical protein EDD56_104127 [Pseudobacteriovorax antillogorgiicola]SMF07295.1 hypothetical protein SAMN06296036_104206 [Pseudobacteriovorax antillogorgiicola]